MSQENAAPPVITDHDEPIVIDNGPLKIDFGRKHEPDGSNKNWKRECLPLKAMIVMLEDALGNSQPFERKKLKESDVLKFELSTEDMGRTESLEIRVVAADEEIVMVSTGDFEKDPRTKGRIKPKGGALRLTKILINGTTFLDLAPNGGFGFRKAVVTLVPKPV